MTPLADQDRVAVLEVRDDKSRVGVRKYRVDGLGSVRKSDDVFPKRKWTGEAGERRGSDLERPALDGVPQVSSYFCLTTAATAAAAAATCRGSGP